MRALQDVRRTGLQLPDADGCHSSIVVACETTRGFPCADSVLRAASANLRVRRRADDCQALVDTNRLTESCPVRRTRHSSGRCASVLVKQAAQSIASSNRSLLEVLGNPAPGGTCWPRPWWGRSSWVEMTPTEDQHPPVTVEADGLRHIPALKPDRRQSVFPQPKVSLPTKGDGPDWRGRRGITSSPIYRSGRCVIRTALMSGSRLESNRRRNRTSRRPVVTCAKKDSLTAVRLPASSTMS